MTGTRSFARVPAIPAGYPLPGSGYGSGSYRVPVSGGYPAGCSSIQQDTQPSTSAACCHAAPRRDYEVDAAVCTSVTALPTSSSRASCCCACSWTSVMANAAFTTRLRPCLKLVLLLHSYSYLSFCLEIEGPFCVRISNRNLFTFPDRMDSNICARRGSLCSACLRV